MTWVIVPAIAALLALLAILVRSGLLRLRESVHSPGPASTLLLERHDLLLKLAERCARHMRYESRRSSASRGPMPRPSPPRHTATSRRSQRPKNGCAHPLRNCWPSRRTTPCSAAIRRFAELRERVMAVDAAIAERRELYNSAVNLLNVRSQAFPHRMIARAIGFHAEALFE